MDSYLRFCMIWAIVIPVFDYFILRSKQDFFLFSKSSVINFVNLGVPWIIILSLYPALLILVLPGLLLPLFGSIVGYQVAWWLHKLRHRRKTE